MYWFVVEEEEELNKLLLMNIYDRDQNVRVMSG